MHTQDSGSGLTPVLEIPTKLLAGTPSQDTITLRVSSEFTTHTVPTSVVDGSKSLGLVIDKNGQPLLFSIGTNQRLYTFLHQDGAREAWQTWDVSPGLAFSKVQLFDVCQTSQHIVLAATIMGATAPALYTSVSRTSEFDPSSIAWVERPSNDIHYVRQIVSLCCGSTDLNTGHAFVTVGTKASEQLIATHYNVETDPAVSQAWKASPLSVTADVVEAIAAGRLSGTRSPGCYALYSRRDGSTGCIFDSFDSSKHYSMITKDDRKELDLGTLRSIYSAVTPYYGCTDLFIAADNGIGYYTHFAPDEHPQVILPGIPFKQVVASEYDTKIVLFAVSDSNELYYVEGLRDKTIQFSYSGLPIRRDVVRLSTAYSVTGGGAELMYIDDKQVGIMHLWRESTTFNWHEAPIRIIAPKRNDPKKDFMQYAAYVTCVTVTNSTTKASVGAGYKLFITSESIYVLINDRTFHLSQRPLELETDDLGQLTIVQRTNEGLHSPSYTLLLKDTSQTSLAVVVNPMQRILTQLSRYTTPESLSNATRTDGRKISFGPQASTNFDATSTVLSQFCSMVHNVDPQAGKDTIPNSRPLDADQIHHFAVNTDGKLTKSDGNWISEAIDDVGQFLGDVWETIKTGLKIAFKFTIRIAKTVVTFLVKVAGKAFKFIISTIGSLVRSFAGFLKDVLGIDITGFLDWLGFVFDMDKIKETQKHLVKLSDGLMTTVIDFVDVLTPQAEGLFDNLKGIISNFIEDGRLPSNTPGSPERESPFRKLLGFIADNPIFRALTKFNPASWLFSQVDDIIGDEVQLPGLSNFVKQAEQNFGHLLGDTAENVARLADSIISKFFDFVTGKKELGAFLKELLGDIIGTVFDGIQLLAMAVLKTLSTLIKAIHVMFTSEIKFPIISDLWELLTDQPMTILNVLTFVPAFGLNAYFLHKNGKLPFAAENIGDPMCFLPNHDSLQVTRMPDLVTLPLKAWPSSAGDDHPSIVFSPPESKIALQEIQMHTNESTFYLQQAPMKVTTMELSYITTPSISFHKKDQKEDQSILSERTCHLWEAFSGLAGAMAETMHTAGGYNSVKFKRQAVVSGYKKSFVDPLTFGKDVAAGCGLFAKLIGVVFTCINPTSNPNIQNAKVGGLLIFACDIFLGLENTQAAAILRALGTVVGSGVSGCLEFSTIQMPPSCSIPRVIGDILESCGAVAGAYAVLSKEPLGFSSSLVLNGSSAVSSGAALVAAL